MHRLPPRAFTILELMIAIVIISALALLSMAGVAAYRSSAQSTRCVNNLRAIGVATAAYAGDNAGALPYYYYRAGTQAGSGAIGGTWYYNLAPYLGVPRVEVATAAANSERTRLGQPGARIAAPCVFTCPAHSPKESANTWKPAPMSWPAEIPVSYAPPTYAKKSPAFDDMEEQKLYARRLADLPYPGRKIWISDSATPNVLNTSSGRWSPDGGVDYNFPYQSFTRHNMGGNALFYDGHVEWLPVTTFTAPAPAGKNPVLRYFDPESDPDRY